MILDKKQMSEEDIKFHYISPAITAKWDSRKITMETQITDGRVIIGGNLVTRSAPKRADYLLYLNANNPIAVVEAKDNNHSVSFGLQQAMTYARMLDLPFAYSSNGDGFMEHDFLTGTERLLAMDAFPTEAELISTAAPASRLTRKRFWTSPITAARPPIRPAITSASPSTAPWMPSPAGRPVCFW